MAKYSIKPIKLGTMLSNLDNNMIIKIVSKSKYDISLSETVGWWKKFFYQDKYSSALGKDIIKMDVRPEFEYSGAIMLRLYID